jgi:hypothetical protein
LARTAAERQRITRERQRRGLLECPAWIPGEAFEAAIDAGAISEEGTEDKMSRAELVALVFCAWAEKLSRRDTHARGTD